MAERAAAMIGFLGTGIIGLQMVRRLAEAGHKVRAWNRSREKTERLNVFGAEVMATPADAIRNADIVIGMLSSGPVGDEVLLGPNGRSLQCARAACLS
jgi:3-hydroxyisobutyrate dehydrogenase-like beta-hydroxyacid dehydrogenase